MRLTPRAAGETLAPVLHPQIDFRGLTPSCSGLRETT